MIQTFIIIITLRMIVTITMINRRYFHFPCNSTNTLLMRLELYTSSFISSISFQLKYDQLMSGGCALPSFCSILFCLQTLKSVVLELDELVPQCYQCTLVIHI